jgi:hypothetical protein
VFSGGIILWRKQEEKARKKTKPVSKTEREWKQEIKKERNK